MNSILRGLASIGEGMASLFSFGQIDADRARHRAGLDDPRPGHVKDAEALASDWDAVLGGLSVRDGADKRLCDAQRAVRDAMRDGTISEQHFQELGDAYGEHVKAYVRR